MKMSRRVSPFARFVERLGHCTMCHASLSGHTKIYTDEGLNFCSWEHWRAWTLLPR